MEAEGKKSVHKNDYFFSKTLPGVSPLVCALCVLFGGWVVDTPSAPSKDPASTATVVEGSVRSIGLGKLWGKELERPLEGR